MVQVELKFDELLNRIGELVKMMDQVTDPPLLYDANEAASKLGIRRTLFDKQVKAGVILSCSIGSRKLFHRDELERAAAQIQRDGRPGKAA
jgi:hypothetical protein